MPLRKHGATLKMFIKCHSNQKHTYEMMVSRKNQDYIKLWSKSQHV